MNIENISLKGMGGGPDDISTGVIVVLSREEAVAVISTLATQLLEDSPRRSHGIPHTGGALHPIGFLLKDEKNSTIVDIKQSKSYRPRVYFTVFERLPEG